MRVVVDTNVFVSSLNATYVVSVDKSLLGVGGYMGISIVTPRQFMDAIKKVMNS